jgi:hypothetical protein
MTILDATIATQPWSPALQRARRLEVAGVIRQTLRPLLDDRARSPRLLWWDQDRVVLWASNAFFLGDDRDVAYANTMLRHVWDELTTEPGPNVFTAGALAGILALHEDKLEPDTRAFALRQLEATLPFGCTRDFQFHGYNDNMPVMWTWALSLGGRLLNDSTFTRIARANLCQLRDLLRRRGAVSEYGANYSTHRLTGIAHIAAHEPDESTRELALQIEARLWAELAGHWSPAVAQCGGAAMRGGSPWQFETSALLRHVLGDDILPPTRPWGDMFDKSPVESAIELGKDPQQYLFAYPFGYAAEFTSADYHVPDDIAALFYRKPSGFTFRATAECGHHNAGVYCKQIPVYGQGGILITKKLTNEEVEIPHFPAHGAQEHGLTTHHGRNFVLGTATTNPFPTSHAFRCTYRRRAPLTGPQDYGDVFVRYNINDKVPCGRTVNRYWKSPEIQEENENYCTLPHDMGRHHCLQHGSTAMCLQVPLHLEQWMLRSMRTDVFFYHAGTGQVGKVYVGDQPVESFPFVCPEPLPVTLDEGAVYLALHPMIGRHHGDAPAMKLTMTEQYLVLSLYNFVGPETVMTQRQMAKLGNGFVFTVRDAQDLATFAEFRQQAGQVRTLDQLYAGVRRAHYFRPDLRLSMHLCPYTQTIMQRSVNGRIDRTPQIELGGLDVGELPFLHEPSVGLSDYDWIRTQIERQAETYNPTD